MFCDGCQKEEETFSLRNLETICGWKKVKVRKPCPNYIKFDAFVCSDDCVRLFLKKELIAMFLDNKAVVEIDSLYPSNLDDPELILSYLAMFYLHTTPYLLNETWHYLNLSPKNSFIFKDGFIVELCHFERITDDLIDLVEEAINERIQKEEDSKLPRGIKLFLIVSQKLLDDKKHIYHLEVKIGKAARIHMKQVRKTLKELSILLNINTDKVVGKIKSLIEKKERLEKEFLELKEKLKNSMSEQEYSKFILDLSDINK